MQVSSEQPELVQRRHTTPAATLPDDALLLQYRRGVLFLIRRECGNATLAEDLCNEALRIAVDRVQSTGLRKPDSFRSFLLQTARNLLLRTRQQEASHRTSTGGQDAIEQFEDVGADVSLNVDVPVWARVIKEVLSELPLARDRKLLVRYYMEDQDKSRICLDLKISKEHFRRVTCRARQRFREILERRYRKSDLL